MIAEIPVVSAPQPPPLRCTCGAEWPYSWYVPRRHGRVYPGRWAAPSVRPCQLCATPPEVLAERELRGRLLAAGIPDPLVIYGLEREHLVQQRPGEPEDSFRHRVAEERTRAPVLGVGIAQTAAYRAVMAWRPPQWLILHGPAGTGKTTILAGLARRLLRVQPETRTERHGRPCVVRTQRRIVEYHRVDEILGREQVKLRGLDDSPTRDVARVGHRVVSDGERTVHELDPMAVLMLDELGLDERPGQAERRLVERILCYRHDHGLCTVIATNRGVHELVGDASIYGRRVGDRLRTALTVALLGESWRSP